MSSSSADPAPNPERRRGLWPAGADELARIGGGTVSGEPAATGRRVLIDSRAGVRAGDLFVGLSGPHFDGGLYAAQALADGAAIALVGRDHAAAALTAAGPGQAVIAVDDPLAALQALAAEARRRFPGPLLAVTGSNGKTTVKDMLVAALGGQRHVTASPLSYNSQVGVALSLLGLDPQAEVAVIECGISQPGEMARLEEMVRPDLGLLTNIGDAHLEGLGDRGTTAREKALLFRRIAGGGATAGSAPEEGGGWVLLPAGEELGREAVAVLGAPLLTLAIGDSDGDGVGDGHGDDGGGHSGGERAGEPRFRLLRDQRGARLTSAAGTVELPIGDGRLLQGHLLVDAALAAAAALLLGGEPAAIAEGLAAWQPAPMRLELSTTPRGLLLINDAYTADPASVEAALAALARERSGGGRAVAVLGGMAQLGMARRAAHSRVGQRVAGLGIDLLVGVGPGGEEIVAAARAAGMAAGALSTVDTPEQAATLLEELCSPGDRVLLKASRPEKLEQVAAILFDAVAPCRLYVDLDRVVANYRSIRRAAAGRGVMAVVKSFGYGIDAVRIGRALERSGVEYLAVAYPDEGVLLRDRGITAPILVQNVPAAEVDKVVRHGLTAQLASEGQAARLSAEAARQRRAVRVHLKVDTGMGRSGALLDEIAGLARAVEAAEWLTLEGLMTHFAAADEPERDPFTRRQIERFDAVRRQLAAIGVEPRWVHAAASAGIVRFPEAHYSMVRSGLALFGYLEVEGRVAMPLAPVLRLITHVLAVKELPADHPVGYGMTYRTGDAPRRIATVAIGYNDGYPWALSNRGWMLVGGARCPVVGRISMDVTTLDVTALGPRVAAGDEAVVFGPSPDEPSLTELARLADTIPYELLTRISARVRRIFRTSH